MGSARGGIAAAVSAARHLLWWPGLIVASAAHAQLRPIEGQSYRYNTVETRSDGTTTLRFATRRTIVFQHDAAGLIAEVTLESIERPDNKAVGAMYAAGNAGLLHRTIRFHLDAAGIVTAIDDADALWAALLGGMEKMGDIGSSASGDPHAAAQAMIAPLRALPSERRQAMLRSIVAPLIAANAATRVVGEREVALPARPPAAPGATLGGTESISRAADGTVTIRLTATGPIAVASPIPPGTTPADPGLARMTVTSVKNIAPTGLLTDSRETRETFLPSPSGIRHTTIETVATLHPAP